VANLAYENGRARNPPMIRLLWLILRARKQSCHRTRCSRPRVPADRITHVGLPDRFANVEHIAAHDGAKPDGRLCANVHVADNLVAIGNEGSFVCLRMDPAKRSDHDFVQAALFFSTHRRSKLWLLLWIRWKQKLEFFRKFIS
jgi:hypothetical protein